MPGFNLNPEELESAIVRISAVLDSLESTPEKLIELQQALLFHEEGLSQDKVNGKREEILELVRRGQHIIGEIIEKAAGFNSSSQEVLDSYRQQQSGPPDLY